MPSAIQVWRTVLDNAGLQHMPLPEITSTLVDWYVCLDISALEGKELDLEQELAMKVAQHQLRYLNVEVLNDNDCDRETESSLLPCREYTSGGCMFHVDI